MAITDLNGNTIQAHIYPNDSDVQNIEIGAGKSAFGKIFFPNCYLTENERSPVQELDHFSNFSVYDENTNCHYIDHFCELQDLTGRNRFNNIICCNPFGYGFNSEFTAKQLLSKAWELLVPNGKLTIIANSSNKFGKYSKALKFHQVSPQEWNFQISALIELNEEHQYRLSHRYYLTNLKVETKPNQLYTLTKI